MRALSCALMLESLALAAGCGHGSSATAPPADSGADDAGDGGVTEVPRRASSLALADIVGLSTHIQLGSDAASVAERAFEWSKLAELGVHRLRTDFTWATIEPSRGSFDYSGYDTLVGEAQQHGVSLLAILGYGVTWATTVQGADDDYPPDHPSDFASFAVAVANRYAGKISEYEVWNEPNAGFRFWKPTLNGDPAGYGALLLAANQVLLAAQPQIHVAYAGTVYNDLVSGPSFVAQSFAKTPGLAASLGTFAMHAYETYPPSRGPESAVGQEVQLADKVATMSGVLAAAGAKPVPIWITEIGWPVTMQVPADQQARYTVRAIVLGALAGVDRFYLYTLLDGPNPSAFPPEDAFGLCTYSGFAADAGTPSEKPAFVGVKTLLGAVGSYHVVKRIPATPSDVYLVQLSGPGGAVAMVAWRATDGAAPTLVAIPLPGPLKVTSIDGTFAVVGGASGPGTVEVGPDPVIISLD